MSCELVEIGGGLDPFVPNPKNELTGKQIKQKVNKCIK